MGERLYLLSAALCMHLFITANTARSAANSFAALDTLSDSEWRLFATAPFDPNSFSGDLEKGIVMFGGAGSRQGAFLRDLQSGTWEILADAPFRIRRCSGDNRTGPLICGGDGETQVAVMRDYKANVWRRLAPAPFPVHDIAGDNASGPIIAGGTARRSVALMRDYKANEWQMLARAPFEVSAVAGDNSKGVIIAGGRDGRQVAVMRDYKANEWQMLTRAPFPVIDVAGSNLRGPVVIGGPGGQKVAYMTNYRENRWRVAADLPHPAQEITGSNEGGYIALIRASSAGRAQRTAVDRVLKTAVVEFAERGDLGVQDAGTIVAEWLTTALNKTGAFEVYERLSLSTVMEEHKLGMSGLLSEQDIAKIGRIRGVEAIVTGSVIKFGDIISVTAKVVDVETAKLIDSADIKVNNLNAVSVQIDQLAIELSRR